MAEQWAELINLQRTWQDVLDEIGDRTGYFSLVTRYFIALPPTF